MSIIIANYVFNDMNMISGKMWIKLRIKMEADIYVSHVL